MSIKYKIVQFKEGGGLWKPCPEPREVVDWTQQLQEADNNDSELVDDEEM